MAAVPSLDDLFALTGVVKKVPKTPTSIPPPSTYNPANPQTILAFPAYRDHLTSLTDNRLSLSSQDLLKLMFKNDPDVSAAVGSFLTLADTPYTMIVRDDQGDIDVPSTQALPGLVRALTCPTDYTKGFSFKPGIAMLMQEMRYMVLLRGVIGNELVFDKNLVPSMLQHVDMATVQFYQKAPGVLTPSQRQPGVGIGLVDLDIPSFFISYHRRDPTSLYNNSDFVSVINTAAARVQVINDLYRIMTVTGFPRVDIKVMEETLIANLPPSIKDDPNPQVARDWINARMNEVANTFAGLRSDQSFVHMDSIEAKIMNDKNPGAGIDITSVIEVLNSQNQAALKTMATVIGRGSGAAGVASVEARIAAMNADQINVPVAAQLNQALTFLINVYGIQGFVEVTFAPAELRPSLELEAQRVLKSSRMLLDLSLGIITDEEYHLAMYNRLPPAGSPTLSGTGFMAIDGGNTIDAADASPNADPLGQSLTGQGAPAAKSNGRTGSKKGPVTKKPVPKAA